VLQKTEPHHLMQFFRPSQGYSEVSFLLECSPWSLCNWRWHLEKAWWSRNVGYRSPSEVETHPRVTETPTILLYPKTSRTEPSSDFTVLSYSSLRYYHTPLYGTIVQLFTVLSYSSLRYYRTALYGTIIQLFKALSYSSVRHHHTALYGTII